MKLSPMHNFMKSYIAHLENICSLSYVDFPNVDTRHYKISKELMYFNITKNLIKISLYIC